MCPTGDIKFFFTVDTKLVKKESPKGANKFYEIKNKHEYIKYTFDEEYIDELNNIREKLLYEQKDEEDSEEINKDKNTNEINNNNKNGKNENIDNNIETTAEEKNQNLNTENEMLFNIAMLLEKDISIEVKSI